MTTQSAGSRFESHSLLGISVGMGAAVAVGLVCWAMQAPPEVYGPVTAGAVGLPAAIDYQLQATRRDTAADIERIHRNQLRRPVGLVVVMLAAALLAFEQICMFSGEGSGLFWLAFLLAMVADFFIASYASHYLGEHPSRWTAVAVVCACVAQLLLLLLSPSRSVKIYGHLYWRGEAHLGATYVGLGLGFLATLGVCWAGVWYGRRRHEKFLEKKLERVKRKAEKEAAKRQPTPDLVDQLTKLAGLRDAGLLTDEEFQATKKEILGPILGRI
jgi:hypothetical protein